MDDVIELVQDVAVLGVTADGDVLTVGVYGGPENVCATVCFTFTDPAELTRNRRRLECWAREVAPLVLVVRGTTVVLFSERQLLGRAVEAVAAG